MAKLLALYRTPKDRAAFDSYYHATHIPIAKKVPGLRKYDISQGIVATPGGPSDYHLVATLQFDWSRTSRAPLPRRKDRLQPPISAISPTEGSTC